MKTIMFPGQGSQYRGMGKGLFEFYKKEVAQASTILGYDLEELCLKDPRKELSKTQFTQPALYVINALIYYKQQQQGILPDYLIGHSLGEYNALLAAGAFDFETGLRLVKKRGELMASATGGGMAAVLGLDIKILEEKLKEGGYYEIDIANFNTLTQVVISGPQEAVNIVVKDFSEQDIKIIPLFVTAPFHSRYMRPASEEFSVFIKNFEFMSLKIPVVSNVTGLLYSNDNITSLLSQQISSPVRWVDSIRLLMGKGVEEYEEIGSTILTKMVKEIQSNCSPLIEEGKIKLEGHKADDLKSSASTVIKEEMQKKTIINLGSSKFRESYGLKYAYVTGAMYRGIASKELVVLMGKAKMLGFLGTGGLSLEEIEENIKYIQSELIEKEAFGMNLLHNFVNPSFEMQTIELYLKYNIKKIEAAAFMQMTLPLVYYRLKGLRKDDQNNVVCDHKLIAKISRPEVAEGFMRPAPERLVRQLLEKKLITQEQALMSKRVPMSHDICVEADSGGHTDRGVAMVLLPSMQSLRTTIEKEFSYTESICIGLAGGIGTPQAVACAFIMGADFVVTGSINQCTVESGISDLVKDLLQEINVQDTDYAPAGDMFEIGAKVQVLKKGVLFAARANKLHALYKEFNSLEEIPEKTIGQLEKSYFKKSISEIWVETKTYLISKGEQSTIKEAELNSKKKMALIFRWYFGYSSRLSFNGDVKEKVNFQVHTGPALGAFNQWVKGTDLEDWRNRHSDNIGIKMMEGAAKILELNSVRM
jgi:trans-AT polyketide synthase/acyltransferase/oxidoreductase domain-containing protein